MKFISIVQMIASALLKPKQRIPIQGVPKGNILDIGAGGEGVIAQIGGSRTVAIDKYLSEIHEARGKAPDARWMVADACSLPFKNRTFDNATAFFSCMYMPNAIKAHVFKETQRVLKKGGEFWIWDVQMSSSRPVFAIRLQADLPGSSIKTVYGVRAKDQSTASICDLLQQAGFEAEIVNKQRYWFLIKAKTNR